MLEEDALTVNLLIARGRKGPKLSNSQPFQFEV